MHKTAPTAEHLAFHEELKGILDKHQLAIGELAVAAILSQVAGSTLAIAMVWDNLDAESALQTIQENCKVGIENGLRMIEALQRKPS